MNGEVAYLQLYSCALSDTQISTNQRSLEAVMTDKGLGLGL